MPPVNYVDIEKHKEDRTLAAAKAYNNVQKKACSLFTFHFG